MEQQITLSFPNELPTPSFVTSPFESMWHSIERLELEVKSLQELTKPTSPQLYRMPWMETQWKTGLLMLQEWLQVLNGEIIQEEWENNAKSGRYGSTIKSKYETH